MGTPEEEIAAVHAAAHAYEAAMVAGDTAAAAACFADDDPVTRFGPEGEQLDRAQVGALRAATTPVAPPVWHHDETRWLAPGVVLHLGVLDRGPVRVQRTQVWCRDPGGWRVVHAHVSRVAGPS